MSGAKHTAPFDTFCVLYTLLFVYYP